MHTCLIARQNAYTVYSERNAHLILIFVTPRGGGGPKIHMVGYV